MSGAKNVERTESGRFDYEIELSATDFLMRPLKFNAFEKLNILHLFHIHNRVTKIYRVKVNWN